MKDLYAQAQTLHTRSRAHIEVNYNRSIYGMTKPTDPLFYKAPSDPAEHPMYVDAEGRIVPVSETTLQPMHNENGHVIDRNGNLVPEYELRPAGARVHIDDIRIAVTSSAFDIKDEEGNDIYIAYDGEIIPTNDAGLPNTVVIDGVVWVLGADGEPHAPLERVYALNSYVKPVRAENVPVNRSGNRTAIIPDIYEEYFDINSIVKAERPSRRGIQVAWATPEGSQAPVYTGVKDYDGPRFYTASSSRPYKYWTSPTTSSAQAVLSGSNLAVFDANWRSDRVRNRVHTASSIAGDFEMNSYIEKVIPLEAAQGYEMQFAIDSQDTGLLELQLHEWADVQPENNPNHSSASKLPVKYMGHTRIVGGGSSTRSFNFVTSANSVTQMLRIRISRIGRATYPRITFRDLNLRKSSYAIDGVGPRAVYDRPIDVNKIVIGVDYSIDERKIKGSSYNNLPADTRVRVLVDRGDGLFEWQTAINNPTISDTGHIVLHYNGSSWQDGGDFGTSTQKIMGVQFCVFSMKRRDARVNIMEISARRVVDVSDLIMDYNISSNTSDNSFVLPFGTINSNSGTITLSNHDGRFNTHNRYLLDRSRSIEQGRDVFTDIPNPFWQILNEPVTIVIETATSDPSDITGERPDWLRMATARTEGDIDPGSDMQATISFTDDSRYLESVIPPQVFFHGPNMSIIQTLYMLLDNIGYTSVRFADEDEHFSTHVKYFWTEKESDNLWAIIAEVCRSTQTVAYFDEYNILNFKSLRGMYIDALSHSPALLATTEDLPGTLANIKEMSIEQEVSANQVQINYKEVSEAEKTPSGVTPMQVAWEPEGTQVIRGSYIMNDLNDKQVGQGGTRYFEIPGDSARTWPFSGLVQIEGEMIKYDAKEYRFYHSNGTQGNTWVKNDDERKALDKRNEFRAFQNHYTGKMRISERGAEGTNIVRHTKNLLNEFTTRLVDGNSATTPYRKGLSITKSRLFVIRQPGVKANQLTTISAGRRQDDRPPYIGTRLRINEGPNAGVCYVSGFYDDGIYAELTTTEATEAAGRPRGELHIFVKRNGVITYHGAGADLPISRYVDHDLDLSVIKGRIKQVFQDYSAYHAVELQHGDRGSHVSILQGALNGHNERLVVDGIFGNATRNAVRRLQSRNFLPRTGQVKQAEWKAMERGQYDVNNVSIRATLNGVHTVEVHVPVSHLPSTWEEGRFGVFTRGRTSASFEYLYGVKGIEEVMHDQSNFFDYVRGGYMSNQLDAGWMHRTVMRWVNLYAGGRALREATTNRLSLFDFGPYVHEVRDYDVVFDTEAPALASYLYFSNESDVHLTDYMHQPFGARFRLVNRSRRDAVVNGEDVTTYGSENAIEQRMLVYGNILNVNDERSVTIKNETALASRGVEELSIDVNWIQSEESAQKLGGHIIEAMSHPVRTFSVDLFGNASIRVGQIIAIYNPQAGVGREDDPENANRFFVTGVSHGNDGTPTTSLTVREVIGSSGMRWATLKDLLRRNNNAANLNYDIERVNGKSVLDGYIPRSGVTVQPSSFRGRGAIRMIGTGATPYQTAIRATPFPTGVGRFPHNFGNYFLLVVTVHAETDAAVQMTVEGWPTTGSMIKQLQSQIRSFKAGETRTVFLRGRFTTDGNIPELEVVLRSLDPKDHRKGAPTSSRIKVLDFFYRDSPNEDDIYPHRGAEHLRK